MCCWPYYNFRHKISVFGAPSGKRLLSASAHNPGGGRRFQRPARRRCCRPGKADPPQSAAGGAHRKKYYALPGDQEDLVSIGTIGLMKAVDTFDATRKARFSTYARVSRTSIRCWESGQKTISQKCFCHLVENLGSDFPSMLRM